MPRILLLIACTTVSACSPKGSAGKQCGDLFVTLEVEKVVTPTEVDVAIRMRYESDGPIDKIVPRAAKSSDNPFTVTHKDGSFSLHLSRFSRSSQPIWNRPLDFVVAASANGRKSELSLLMTPSDKEGLPVKDFSWKQETECEE